MVGSCAAFLVPVVGDLMFTGGVLISLLVLWGLSTKTKTMPTPPRNGGKKSVCSSKFEKGVKILKEIPLKVVEHVVIGTSLHYLEGIAPSL